ncbi:MAG: protein phosphatase 2C domain-containing protein [Marinobacter sp.]|nr:protein phosphatase 2C domain-containing protein [Marinobacter sp.]
MNFRSTGFTHRGGVRAHNEDAYFESPESGVWVVADGMGGYQAGDVASQMVCDTVAGELRRLDADVSVSGLEQALQLANQRIRTYGQQNLEGKTLGCTVVALLIHDGVYHLLWAGDSRCYLARRGQVQQLSRDHSQVADMVDQGLLSPEEADKHPLAHVITRALGVEDDIALDYRTGHTQPGDQFLLCSDGVSKEFSEEEFAGFFSDGNIEDASLAIMHAALVNKCSDNITCIIVNLEQGCYIGSQSNIADDVTVPFTLRSS